MMEQLRIVHDDSQRRTGLLVPLFSVFSEESVGIGDFNDLRHLMDWAGDSGHSIVQLLPLNDTGTTFCPYDAVSSFALEPAYIALNSLPGTVADTTAEQETLREQFPFSTRVDWRIKEEKLLVLRNAFAGFQPSDNTGFQQFREKNSYWLDDYTLFTLLKEQNSLRPWYAWDEPLKNREPEAISSVKERFAGELTFRQWIQWTLYEQLRAASEYAREQNISLMGDLPILVARDSADVWAHPDYFKLPLAAGAPPDMYAKKGQRWGMPTYDWEAIANDDYRYVGEKLRYASSFYDLLRVDHVVGLFRIWSIPFGEPIEHQGLNGFFDPADEQTWEEHGRTILTIMRESSPMILCAEDLGMIPPACPKVLGELAIPGTEVQRWTKDWPATKKFIPANAYRECAVATLSTHDTTPYAVWWEYEATEEEREELRELFGYTGAPSSNPDPDLLGKALAFVLHARSVFAVHNVLDWLAYAQLLPGDLRAWRFNTPGTVSPENWSLRLPLTLEELLESPLTEEMGGFIKAAGRGMLKQ